jgi:carboxypeptidase Q
MFLGFGCWAEAQDAIQKDGLKVYEEPVKIPSWVRGQEYATLLSPRVKNVRLAGLGGSVGTPNGKAVVAKALVVSSFEELERRSKEVEGKIVVFNVEFVDYGTTVQYRYNGPAKAEKLGAVAVLVRSISPFGLQTVHTGSTSNAGIPAAAVTLEDAKMFARMQARNQDVVIELYMEAHTLPDQSSR